MTDSFIQDNQDVKHLEVNNCQTVIIGNGTVLTSSEARGMYLKYLHAIRGTLSHAEDQNTRHCVFLPLLAPWNGVINQDWATKCKRVE